MAAVPEDASETSREDRRNAILTYREVNSIFSTLTRLDTKMDTVADDIAAMTKTHDDHEVRIRALELSHARIGASSGMASNLWHAVWPAAAVVISLLAYLAK